MTKIKFAIIGCGRIAQRHAEHINRQGILAAVCDIETAKADKMAQEYGAKAYNNIDDLLQASSEIDVISIAAPMAYMLNTQLRHCVQDFTYCAKSQWQ